MERNNTKNVSLLLKQLIVGILNAQYKVN